MGLGSNLNSVRDHLLSRPTIPTLDEVYSGLLRVSLVSPPTLESSDRSALLSSTPPLEKGGSTLYDGHRSHNTSHPWCTHCNKWGHIRDKYFKLHGRPPWANVAHNTASTKSVTSTGSNYDEYVAYQATKQSSSSPIASIAHPGTFLGPWVLDSGASRHLSGNLNMFSTFHMSHSLPSVILADGSKALAKIVGNAQPLPCVPLTSVLYVPYYPFNLVSVRQPSL